MKQFIALFSVLVLALSLVSCDMTRDTNPVSSSGVTKKTVEVNTDANGNTVEQNNISYRLDIDNEVGSVKHLYIVSPYSGDCILYSTVIGKVTSSGKRLTPTSVIGDGSTGTTYYNYVDISGKTFLTNELIQDDGTYGSSSEYIYWKDAAGNYNQYFMSGNAILYVSSVPRTWPKVILNMETGATNVTVQVKGSNVAVSTDTTLIN